MDNVPKTVGIKLSEIRPCDNCGGQIVPLCRVVDVRMCLLNTRNANSVLGMMQMAGWHGSAGLAIAEAMAPGADAAFEVLDEEPATTRLFICSTCWLKELDLVVLVEAEHERQEKNEAKNEATKQIEAQTPETGAAGAVGDRATGASTTGTPLRAEPRPGRTD